MGAAIFAANDILENKGKNMKRTIQGPALVANVEGLVKTAGLPRAKQKSVVTGFSSGVFLDPSDLAPFNCGQVEVADGRYLIGNIKGIAIKGNQLKVTMWLNIRSIPTDS